MAKRKTKSEGPTTLDMIMAEYNEAAGVTVVGPLSAFDLDLEVIPTGNLILDVATGIGGFARGKMYEVAGDKASGKSTLCMSLARQHLLLTDKKVLYVDIEDAATKTFLDNFGMFDFGDRFTRSTQSIAEIALDIAFKAIKTGEVSLVVIDSVAAVIPQGEFDKNLGDVEQIGEKAKLIQRFIQKVNPLLGVTKTTLVLVNQLRTNIKLAKINPNINPMKSTGGKAVEYFPSFKVTLQPKSPGKNKRYFDDLGIKLSEPIKCLIGKNKLARTCDFGIASTLRLGFGFDIIYDLIDLAELAYQINYAGAWVKVSGKSVAQGIPKFYNVMLEDGKLRQTLLERTLPLVGINDIDVHKAVMDDFIKRKKESYDAGLITFHLNADNVKEEEPIENDE